MNGFIQKLIFIFCLATLHLQSGIGQYCLKGFIIQDNAQPLLKIGLAGYTENDENISILEISEIDKFGHFVFQCNPASYPHYKLVLLDQQADSIINPKSDCITPKFLLANTESLNLNLDSCLSTDTEFNVNAFEEWKRFLKFQERSTYDVNNRLSIETRDFIKDSLEILLVKLFGTKTLKNKQLLAADIKENHLYYEDFLNELKESTIDPADYHFLEAEVLKLKNHQLSTKFKMSFLLNIVLISITISLLAYILVKITRERKNPDSLLSVQEKKIKALIVAGKSNKQIGAELFISVSTVKTHISNIYQKLGIRSRKDLINM